MDVENIFHMTGGYEHNSYANNSSLQKRASDMMKHIALETLEQVFLSLEPTSIGVADLGCSSGPNTLSVIKDLVRTVESASSRISRSPLQEFRVYLNDLPTNDFNSLFKSLPDFCRELKKETDLTSSSYDLFISGCPGSFYGRLFPNNCLHYIYSSYSLHWLSKVPPSLYDDEGKPLNKGNVYIWESSPPLVSEAYFAQFQKDISLFLRSRSDELVTGGRMVLIFLGRIGPAHTDRGNSFYWHLLGKSLSILASQGKIEEEKLDSYDVHFYAPSRDEIEAEMRKEGSLELERLEMFDVDRRSYEEVGRERGGFGKGVADTVRAIQESMIKHHFGEAIIEPLFDIYARLVDEEICKEDITPITFIAVLKKL